MLVAPQECNICQLQKHLSHCFFPLIPPITPYIRQVDEFVHGCKWLKQGCLVQRMLSTRTKRANLKSTAQANFKWDKLSLAAVTPPPPHPAARLHLALAPQQVVPQHAPHHLVAGGARQRGAQQHALHLRTGGDGRAKQVWGGWASRPCMLLQYGERPAAGGSRPAKRGRPTAHPNFTPTLNSGLSLALMAA